MARPPALGRSLVHLLWMAAFALPFNLALVHFHSRRVHTVDAREKQAAYVRAPREWNLVFLGDSRTYTDVDPDRLDPLLGTHSLNLAYWAQWFPTQYASYRDLIPHIPPGTVVVWSVGEGNFRAVQRSVNSTYPIRPWLVPRYLGWGYALTDLQDNVAGGVLDVLPAHALRDPLRNFLGSRWSEIVSALPAAAAPARAAESRADEAPTAPTAGAARPAGFAEYERKRAAYEADPRVTRVRPWIDEGRITSIEVMTRRGFYQREELDSLYFRHKQQELAARTFAATSEFTAETPFWNTFVAILDEFRQHHVRLIVNQVGEAPFRYATGENRRDMSDFMGRVRREVEARGYPFIAVDWERFENADYFDYNHLNRRGVERFTPLLAAALRPHLK